MKLALVRILTFALFMIGCARAQTPGISVGDRNQAQVVGGQLVTVTDPIAKSTVMLLTYNEDSGDVQICSGSLITHRLIVTAAHCLVDAKGARLSAAYKTYVSFSQSVSLQDLASKINLVFIDPGQSIIHHGYKKNDEEAAHDLALLQLSADAPAPAGPIAILKDPSILKAPMTTVFLAGYGQSSPDGAAEAKSGVFRLRIMQTMTEESFANMPNLLTMVAWPTRSLLHGDSGGPGVIKVGTQLFLFGVAQGMSVNADYYTDLNLEMPWLKATAAALGSPANF